MCSNFYINDNNINKDTRINASINELKKLN